MTASRFALSVVTILVSFGVTLVAHAQEEAAATSRTRREAFNPDDLRKMPKSFRIAFLGGANPYVGERKFENDNTNLVGFSGSIMLAYGRKTIAFETGATFMNLPYSLGIKDAFGTHRSLVNVQYVGVPLILKYNYIERPLASFFFKAGAIPVAVVNQSSKDVMLKDGQNHAVVLPKNDLFAVAGFGGTSEITSTTAFVVDFTAFYGTTPSESDSHIQGLAGSIGISLEI